MEEQEENNGRPDGLPQSLIRAWGLLDDKSRALLSRTDESLLLFVLQSSISSIEYFSSRLNVSMNVLHTTTYEKAKLEEARVIEIASRELEMSVFNTSATPHSLDACVHYSCVLNRGRIGIEVKNYARTVPTEEVDKFRRDLSMGDFACGVFISTKAPIAKMQKGIHISTEFCSIQGPVTTIFASPMTDATDVTRCALSLAKHLTENGWGSASANTRMLVPSTSVNRLANSMQMEIFRCSDMRKRLTETENQVHKAISKVSESALLMQDRLSSSLRETQYGDADTMCQILRQYTESGDILAAAWILSSSSGHVPSVQDDSKGVDIIIGKSKIRVPKPTGQDTEGDNDRPWWVEIEEGPHKKVRRINGSCHTASECIELFTASPGSVA